MWLAKDLIVISDLHLAAEHGEGLFQADKQLTDFLRWFHESVWPGLLILNGDSFDFLVDKEPQTKLDPDEATTQAAAIVSHHPDVFAALSVLANSNDHELIILGGNHDPELSLPTVQREFERSLDPSCSHPPMRWLTNGEAALFEVGGSRVLVEHGDQYDAWNWIDHEALRRVVCLASRNVDYQDTYALPPGSQLVINRFNLLRGRFPWLSTLQPLTPAMLPLALEVILPAVSSEERNALLGAAGEFTSYNLRSVTYEVLRKLQPKAEFWAVDEEERQLLIDWLEQYERESDTWGVAGWTVEKISRALSRLRGSLATRLLRRVSATETFYSLEEEDASVDSVARLVEHGTHLVAHGHTHSAKSYLVGDGLYLNSGTWGQLTKLPDSQAPAEVWADFLSQLKEGQAETFSRPTFLRVKEVDGKTTAALFEWRDGGPDLRAAWLRADGHWQKEE